MAPPDDPVFATGTAVILIWTASTLCGKGMAQIGMPGLLGNLLSGILLKNAIPYPGGSYDYNSAVCPDPPLGWEGSGSSSASGSASGSSSSRTSPRPT